MFGKMYHGFINLKYPLIYINDKHNTLTFIKDNVFNHMNATNTKKDEGLKKANAIKEKQIDKNKIYLFFINLIPHLLKNVYISFQIMKLFRINLNILKKLHYILSLIIIYQD